MKVLGFPLARIAIGFLSGIVGAYYVRPNFYTLIILCSAAVIFFITSFFLNQKKGKGNLFFGLATLFISFCAGSLTLVAHTDTYQQTHYTHNKAVFEKETNIAATILERIKSSTKNDRYTISVQGINGTKTSGRLLLNIPKNATQKSFIVGAHLFIKGKIIPNKKPYNPSLFDYASYLENKQIYGQIYSKEESITVRTQVNKDILYYCSSLTTTIENNLKKTSFDPKSLAVAMALIVGQKQDLAPEILHDYQFAGAIHILSVSGLHIGFILLFLNFILSPIPNTKKGNLIKLGLSLSLLILFAILAGLSPSVIRSVVMYGFIATGYYLKRTTYIYHTILLSILVIVLFQPYFLFDAGFQLSYLAVFFIIWLQPLLSEVWTPKYKIVQFSWNILTVSCAAQIGTLPLSLYYFHQFPGLFFITNLLILPFLSVVMFLGIVVMLLAAYNFTPAILILPFEWCIEGMNLVINKIASVHAFVLQDIPFNSYLMVTTYLLIITIIVWFKKPNYTKLIAVFIAILCCQTAYLKTAFDTQSGEELLVFNQINTSMIAIRKGNSVLVQTNDSSCSTTTNTNLKGYLVSNFTALEVIKPLENVAYFKGNRILILDSLGIYPKNCTPDVLLLTQSPKINMDRLLLNLHPKVIIADGTNYKNIQQNWKKTCQKNKIPFHATAEKGFYKM
ncbi:competence protein ComEC [Flavobacterium faecale]|uniref:Competence protein ComEC n=1 Tax=Flavobacterium faecale TaxID=1355330 RepID=A0A2S1LBU2_9FLAO|nr:ComEC/Rec2 family competence protein [Flavobacterium faecale]AWG21215.1 competence protein ComEC [Flavobacterium faecale]